MRSKPPDSGSTDKELVAAGKYHTLLELGRGGTAVVSAAMARGIGGFTKLVVLKNIKEEFLADRETVRMFINEARLSARMNHPNVVQVYEVYRQNRSPVIVMEYLEGQSLARLLPRAYADPSYATDLSIAILCRVLAGLSYAHTLTDYDGSPLRIVHRDVSPHNVMVTYDGQVKLVDFGIAKLSARTEDTKTGVIKGKIAYMAPEQLEGAPLDPRTDLFAVGVMLWEVLARRRMWGSRSDAEIVRCLVLDEVPKLAQAAPDVDRELASITERALAVLPEARYGSAAELQGELEAYLDRRGVVVRQQDIGDLVSRCCADLRAGTAERLSAELGKVAAALPGQDDPLASFDALQTPLPEGRSSRRWLWLAALPLALASATGAYLWSQARTLPAAPGESRAPRAVEPARQPARPADRVLLRLSLAPPHARATLDGRPLAPLATGSWLPRDELEHELRVEAEGHEPAIRRLSLAADVTLVVALAPLPPVVSASELPDESASPATKRRARRPPPSPPPPEPPPAEEPPPEPPAPAVLCDPPHYIGPDGLKHYRRECL